MSQKGKDAATIICCGLACGSRVEPDLALGGAEVAQPEWGWRMLEQGLEQGWSQGLGGAGAGLGGAVR